MREWLAVWKEAFTLLLSVNLMIIVIAVAWFLSLPRIDSVKNTSTSNSNTVAHVYVDVGEQAVNAYLQAAISQQPDVNRILAYAKVDFQDTWRCDVGIKLDKREVPFDITFSPSVNNGNLDLQVVNATMDAITMKDTLANIIELLPLPKWMTFEPATDTLQIKFS